MPETKRPSNNPNGRPPLPESEKAKAITFRLHPRVIATLKAKADQAGVSDAQLVALAVESYQPSVES